jgi:hypothetical protein
MGHDLWARRRFHLSMRIQHVAQASKGWPDATPGDRAEAARRKRQPTGRDHQFNVRLRRETLEFIYCQANGRNIPVAQVIEEACEALQYGCQG